MASRRLTLTRGSGPRSVDSSKSFAFHFASVAPRAITMRAMKVSGKSTARPRALRSTASCAVFFRSLTAPRHKPWRYSLRIAKSRQYASVPWSASFFYRASHAVILSTDSACTFAPASNSVVITSGFSLESAAHMSAVHPSISSRASRSAPASRSIMMTSGSPLNPAANMSAVNPASSRAFRSAPASRCALMISGSHAATLPRTGKATRGRGAIRATATSEPVRRVGGGAESDR